MSEAMTYKLPPLPEPAMQQIDPFYPPEAVKKEFWFSAQQMQAYAIAAIEEQGVPDGWREFVQRVAGQKPEKPDYWSACGQCERNISDAEDLLASAPPAQQAKPAQRVIANIKHDKLGHPYAVMKTAYDDEGNGLEEGAALVLASDQQARKE